MRQEATRRAPVKPLHYALAAIAAVAVVAAGATLNRSDVRSIEPTALDGLGTPGQIIRDEIVITSPVDPLTRISRHLAERQDLCADPLSAIESLKILTNNPPTLRFEATIRCT